MRRTSTQQRVLGGALLLAASVWAVDWFTGGARVTPARAAPGATPSTPPTPAPVDWQDLDALVAQLTHSGYTAAREDLEQLQRDLFLPTRRVEEACAPPEPAIPQETKDPPPIPTSQPDFRSRHKLTGVVIGTTPLAVIDGTVLPLNSDLEGYTLIEVQRDYVVFRQSGTDERIVLALERRR
jgi:hypothetical protein